jgi:hypothetical protein
MQLQGSRVFALALGWRVRKLLKCAEIRNRISEYLDVQGVFRKLEREMSEQSSGSAVSFRQQLQSQLGTSRANVWAIVFGAAVWRELPSPGTLRFGSQSCLIARFDCLCIGLP